MTATGATSLQNVKTGQNQDTQRNRGSVTRSRESPRGKLRTARPRPLTRRRHKQGTSTPSQGGSLLSSKVGGHPLQPTFWTVNPSTLPAYPDNWMAMGHHLPPPATCHPHPYIPSRQSHGAPNPSTVLPSPHIPPHTLPQHSLECTSQTSSRRGTPLKAAPTSRPLLLPPPTTPR